MREARSIMAELATSGLSPEQLALVMELTASVAAEARPMKDQAAENKRAYDREYRRQNRRPRTKSYDKDDPPPNDIYSNPHRDKPSPNGDGQKSAETQVVETWNAMAKRTGLGGVRKITHSRRAALRQRLNEFGLPTMLEAIERIERSDFCAGRTDRWKGASFDFLVSDSKFTRLLEGVYDNRAEPANDAKPRAPMTAAERETMARYHEGRGEFDKADKLRREATGPPRSIGQLAGNIVARADHGQA